MAKLTYTATMSLDGCIQDAAGNLDWGAPDEEVFSFINGLVRPIGTFLFGRRMYETMIYWETVNLPPDTPAAVLDFTRIWQATEKIVYSKTLETVSSARTRLERDFDAEAVREMKSTAAGDISVGGSELAAEAIKAGLVDELHLFIVPIVLGGGKRWLPPDVPMKLELLEERRFRSGRVYLRYRVIS